MVSRIIKVKVRVVSLILRLRLVTRTLILIKFFAIAKTSTYNQSLIIKITISSIVIGIKKLLFSTNSLAKLLSDILLSDSLLSDSLLLDSLLSDSSISQSH